jgi:MYXO-CTERM domain-containing protein
MQRIILTIILLFSTSAASAAWYQKTDGTIWDPIQGYAHGFHQGDHPYSGNNLEPYADLTGATVSYAFLVYADLTGANLTNADLDWAQLRSADLTGVDLTNAYMYATNLDNADLTDANLTNADLTWAGVRNANLSGLDLSNLLAYVGANWSDAFYDYRNEPTWDSGMDAAWRDMFGIHRTTPEPSAILLALLGLALLPRRRRR